MSVLALAALLAQASLAAPAPVTWRPGAPLRVLRGGASDEDEPLPQPKLASTQPAGRALRSGGAAPQPISEAVEANHSASAGNATAEIAAGPRGPSSRVRKGPRGRGRPVRGRGAQAGGRGAARMRAASAGRGPAAVKSASTASNVHPGLAVGPAEQREADEAAALERLRSVLLWKVPATSALILAAGNAAFAAAAFGPLSLATTLGGLAFWLVLFSAPFALTLRALAKGVGSPHGSVRRSLASVALSLSATLPPPLQPGGELLPSSAAAAAARAAAAALNRGFAALRDAGAVESRAHTVHVLLFCFAVRTAGRVAGTLQLLWACFLSAFALPYLYTYHGGALRREVEEVTQLARGQVEQVWAATQAAVAQSPVAGLWPAGGEQSDEGEETGEEEAASS
eukprot:scaffold8237_cov84-Isochrysis_galbana.AAC.1